MIMQVRRISQLVLKREHAYIDTVGLGCVETPTKVAITYSFLILSYKCGLWMILVFLYSFY